MKTRPFELSPEELPGRLDEMVEVTFEDLVSEFLVLPKGTGYISYPEFREAYEILKRHTRAFTSFETPHVLEAVKENSRVFGVLRSILGMSAPEWAEIANTEMGIDVNQTAARNLDRKCRENASFYSDALAKHQLALNKAVEKGKDLPAKIKSLERIESLTEAAVNIVSNGAPTVQRDMIHRLDQFDTRSGTQSLEYCSKENIPYAVLLYERYLGRPFASHRDAVSELVGEVMENAIENVFRRAGVSYRKTNRAEKIPGFGQAPDFCIPDEHTPAVIIEAKITSDDGTARDKVARIKELETQRNQHVAQGWAPYEVVACIDGRGFRQRKEDMRQLLIRLDGKVFTSTSLESLLEHTKIRNFVSKSL